MGQVQQWRKTGTEQVNVVTKTAAAAAAVWVGHVTSKTDSRFFKCQVIVIYSTVLTSDYDPSNMFTFLRISICFAVVNI